MNISESIYNQGLDAGYSHIGALPLKDIENRAIGNIKKMYPWAKSMIIASFHYNFYKVPSQLEGKVSKKDLFIGRYLEGSHEHSTAKEFEAIFAQSDINYLDMMTLPSSTKSDIAAEMGIGLVRTNGYFYTEEGSYCHLHGWVVDKEIICDFEEPPTACPNHCSICVRTCPQKALSKTWKDPSKCSTFERNNAMDQVTKACDQCQDFCPFNKGRWAYEESFIGLVYD